MILSYDSYSETLEKQKQKDNDIEELKRSVAFLTSQPENKILYDENSGIVKGIQVDPEMKNIITGKVITSNKNKK